LGTILAGPTFHKAFLDRPFETRAVAWPARTLRDAANYIRKLPESQRDKPEWRLAVQMLLDAVDNCGPMLFARMGIERAESRQPLAHRRSLGRGKLKRV
jgi:hypothetical protein